MRFELRVGSSAFWQRARQDIARARERVLVQAMTFEGDRTGLAVAAAIEASQANDRRVLVDAYSQVFVSDHWVLSPLARRNPEFCTEVRATGHMFRRLQHRGVGVVVTNPVGLLGAQLPARNHKKLLVMDGVAYLGGINFSDHNFAWDDLMLRCEDRAIADYLAQDFTRTFDGEPAASEARFPGVHLISLSGLGNERMFEPLLQGIERAQQRIDVFSPYLTFPFCDALADARRRGVHVTLYTCAHNNKAAVHDYTIWAARRAGFEVRVSPGMSHLKAMLLDDTVLALGSSNFDFVSYHAQAELLAIVSDPELVATFKHKVLLRRTEPLSPAHATAALRGRIAFTMLKVAEGATRVAGARLRAERAARAARHRTSSSGRSA